MKTRTVVALVALSCLLTLTAQKWIPLNRWTQWLVPQYSQGVSSNQAPELLGYTQYTQYLTASKEALQGQAKLLTATVTRQETTTQNIERVLLPRLSTKLSSSATIAVHYQVQYAFGYDFKPDQFDIRPGEKGLEIHIAKPQLIATPAVTDLRHEILSKGILTDEDASTLKLYEQAAQQAQANATSLSQDPAIIALCEKQLIEFVQNFLSQHSKTQWLPSIRVIYPNSGAIHP